MTDNELLLAIANIMDKKLDARLTPIETDIHDMKSDIKSMKADILDLQNDVRFIKDDVSSIHLTQENIILPRLNTIHYLTAWRFSFLDFY